MSTFNSKLKSNDCDEKGNAKYVLHYYAISAGIIGTIFIIAVIFSYIFLSKEFKTYIVVFANVILALLSIISLIAMFREVSRLHAREFPFDTIDKIKALNKRVEQLENAINSK